MRLLHPYEVPVVRFLFESAGRLENPAALLVEPMEDGGMGSLRFVSTGPSMQYGATVAACKFEDTDGTLVSAVLNVDENNALLEMDIWKVDFTPLSSWPDQAQIMPADV